MTKQTLGQLEAVARDLGPRAEILAHKSTAGTLKAGIARIETLVEEQNARNRIVLDGIAALLSRQSQVEQPPAD